MEVNGQLSFGHFENIYSSIYAKLNKENEKGGKAYEDAAILTTNVLLHQDQGINVIITIVNNNPIENLKPREIISLTLVTLKPFSYQL